MALFTTKNAVKGGVAAAGAFSSAPFCEGLLRLSPHKPPAGGVLAVCPSTIGLFAKNKKFYSYST